MKIVPKASDCKAMINWIYSRQRIIQLNINMNKYFAFTRHTERRVTEQVSEGWRSESKKSYITVFVRTVDTKIYETKISFTSPMIARNNSEISIRLRVE